MSTDREHANPTRKNKRYMFTAKHHGGGTSQDAQWHPSMSDEEEFLVFDGSDFHDIYDGAERYLYGVFRKEQKLTKLGTWHQYIAEFPKASEGTAWHGYPLYPVIEPGAPNRSGDDAKPPKVVFLKLQDSGLINAQERKRLQKGKHP